MNKNFRFEILAKNGKLGKEIILDANSQEKEQ